MTKPKKATAKTTKKKTSSAALDKAAKAGAKKRETRAETIARVKSCDQEVYAVLEKWHCRIDAYQVEPETVGKDRKKLIMEAAVGIFPNPLP